MLYHLLVPLSREFPILRVFNYISFRAVGAAVTALILAFVVGPMVLRRLRSMAVHQVVREGTPDSHAGKGTTPTMGGIIILISAIIPTLLWARLSVTRPYVYIAVIVTLWMGCIGFIDDYLKMKQKREGKKNVGLVESNKLIGRIVIGAALGIFLWKYQMTPNLPGASTSLPFFKYVLVVPLTARMAWL